MTAPSHAVLSSAFDAISTFCRIVLGYRHLHVVTGGVELLRWAGNTVSFVAATKEINWSEARIDWKKAQYWTETLEDLAWVSWALLQLWSRTDTTWFLVRRSLDHSVRVQSDLRKSGTGSYDYSSQ